MKPTLIAYGRQRACFYAPYALLLMPPYFAIVTIVAMPGEFAQAIDI